MIRLGLALILGLLASGGALAQNFTMPPPAGVVVGGFVVVSSCGGQSLSAGQAAFGTIDTTGKVCIGSSSGGSTTANQGTPAAITGAWPVAPSPYPLGAVPITASVTGTTNATTATLTNVTSHTTYICGFSIRANATGAATNNATVTGTITGTLNFTQWTAPLASGIGVTEEMFSPCIPASAVSTSIAVVSGAPGSGGVVSVTAWGYSI
jgi:hypothetical protein